MKYSDYFVDQLVLMGYTHCFFVSGGNVMHLLESARTRMKCVAVTHEVSAVIAAEYFNVAQRASKERAVAFVTAGPGLTNAVTGLAGAWLESREVLLIGGQARSSFLSKGTVRQIGHQEIDGVAIASPITVKSVSIDKPIPGFELARIIEASRSKRKGPVFLEVCLDVTLMEVDFPVETAQSCNSEIDSKLNLNGYLDRVMNLLSSANRPLMIVGGGLDFSSFQDNLQVLREAGLPVATTWNAADYISYDSEIYAGRPNTYGMRWANAVIQQCDLLISVGARLGLQQTGFNVEQFAPLAKIVRIDIDEQELNRSEPLTEVKVQEDANSFLRLFATRVAGDNIKKKWPEWLNFVQELKRVLPPNEKANDIFSDFLNPFEFVEDLSIQVTGTDLVIPCSSGGSYTTMMQAFKQKCGNLLTNNKGLASMGYGLAGAIGTSIAKPSSRVILVEGDGGFAQNLQELGTVVNRSLNLKIFLFDNGGYASIRISQKSYFDGNYLGCDKETGIELPDWEKLFSAWGIDSHELRVPLSQSPQALQAFNSPGPAAFILKINKDQPFLPKITSRVNPDGSISSNPIHLMHPPLDAGLSEKVFRFLPIELRS